MWKHATMPTMLCPVLIVIIFSQDDANPMTVREIKYFQDHDGEGQEEISDLAAFGKEVHLAVW